MGGVALVDQFLVHVPGEQKKVAVQPRTVAIDAFVAHDLPDQVEGARLSAAGRAPSTPNIFSSVV